MKTHTVIGAETLNAALAKFPGAEFLRMARAILLGEAGTHFDPRMIQAFQEAEGQFIQIREQFNEDRAEAA